LLKKQETNKFNGNYLIEKTIVDENSLVKVKYMTLLI